MNANDGEPKAWDLEKCLKQRYTKSADPVRLNAELFVALRNEVEHRYEHNLKIATGGKAQALVMNYEQETVACVGATYSRRRRRFGGEIRGHHRSGRPRRP